MKPYTPEQFDIQIQRLKYRLEQNRWELTEDEKSSLETEENLREALGEEDRLKYAIYYNGKPAVRLKALKKLLHDIGDLQITCLRQSTTIVDAFRFQLDILKALSQNLKNDAARKDRIFNLVMGLVSAALPFGRIVPALNDVINIYFQTTGPDDFQAQIKHKTENGEISHEFAFDLGTEDFTPTRLLQVGASYGAQYLIAKGGDVIGESLSNWIQAKLTSQHEMNGIKNIDDIIGILPLLTQSLVLELETNIEQIKIDVFKHEKSKSNEIKDSQITFLNKTFNKYPLTSWQSCMQAQAIAKKGMHKIETDHFPVVPAWQPLKSNTLTTILNKIALLEALLSAQAGDYSEALAKSWIDQNLVQVHVFDSNSSDNKKALKAHNTRVVLAIARRLQELNAARELRLPIRNNEKIIDDLIGFNTQLRLGRAGENGTIFGKQALATAIKDAAAHAEYRAINLGKVFDNLTRISMISPSPITRQITMNYDAWLKQDDYDNYQRRYFNRDYFNGHPEGQLPGTLENFISYLKNWQSGWYSMWQNSLKNDATFKVWM